MLTAAGSMTVPEKGTSGSAGGDSKIPRIYAPPWRTENFVNANPNDSIRQTVRYLVTPSDEKPKIGDVNAKNSENVFPLERISRRSLTSVKHSAAEDRTTTSVPSYCRDLGLNLVACGFRMLPGANILGISRPPAFCRPCCRQGCTSGMIVCTWRSGRQIAANASRE